MRGAGDVLSVGERIAFYRRRRGMTQRVLAHLVGRSEDWLSKIERNERDLRRLDVLAEVAAALRVSVADLLGNPVLVEGDQAREDDLPAVRDALMNPRRLSSTLFGAASTRSVDVELVARQTEHGWEDYQHGRLGRVIATLPGLIGSAQALEGSSAPPKPHRSWAVSARIHHLAATTLAKVGESELAWMSAERAMSAAEQSEDPLSLASAARAGTHALLAVGRFDEAVELGETAARWVSRQVRVKDPAALSIVGMLYLRTAVAAARRQDRSTTADLIGRASTAAQQLGGDENHWYTSFGPTNVQLHRLSTSLDLGDVLYVLDHGPGVDTTHLSTERSVSHQIDLARAYNYDARTDEALHELLTAEQAAPQIVRHNAAVRETVKALHRRGHVNGTNRALIGLAERCRAIQ